MRRRGAGPLRPSRARILRVEAILQAQLVRQAHALRESHKLRATGEKNVLSVIHLDIIDLERGRAAAEQTPAFKKLQDPGLRPPVNGAKRAEAGETPTDDRYALESHDRTTTRNFSVFDSAARARSGSPGSRSIFFSSSS